MESTETSSTRFGVPVALLGVMYFSAFAVSFVLLGWSPGAPRWFSRLWLTAAAAGALSSLGFLFIMGVLIKGICPWCFASHAINFLMVGIVFWSFRSIRQQEASGNSSDPGYRMLSVAGSITLALWSTAIMGHFLLSISHENAGMRESLAAIQKESGVLEMAFYGQETSDVSLREDNGAEGRDRDATIDAASGYRNTLVVFGDAECSACRRFHEMLDSEIRPSYGSHLRVIFKHLPLTDIHPSAMASARALEAARAQEKFWPYLDALYERQAELTGLNYIDLASDMGMDREQFLTDMESDVTTQRINEDIQLAADLGLEGTPAVYLNNRRVSGAIRNLAGFWQSQASRLKTQREEKGQGWNAEGLVESAGESH